MRTEQQKRLVDALIAAGFDIERKRDASGVPYSLYGNAYAYMRDRDAEALLIEKADWIAGHPDGYEVTIYELSDGRTLGSITGRTWANAGHVIRVPREGDREIRRVEIREQP